MKKVWFMDKSKQKIIDLVKEDQKNIVLYTNGNLTIKKYLAESEKLSKGFILLLKSHGFPYRNISTKKTYESAVTLALHVSIKELKKIHNKYIKNSKHDQILPMHKILFVDKIMILAGKPQIYGSQYKIINKKIELLLIKDPDVVDIQRKKAGVEPLSKYLRLIRANLP